MKTINKTVEKIEEVEVFDGLHDFRDKMYVKDLEDDTIGRVIYLDNNVVLIKWIVPENKEYEYAVYSDTELREEDSYMFQEIEEPKAVAELL
jgi:hypothetical protein